MQADTCQKVRWHTCAYQSAEEPTVSKREAVLGVGEEIVALLLTLTMCKIICPFRSARCKTHRLPGEALKTLIPAGNVVSDT